MGQVVHQHGVTTVVDFGVNLNRIFAGELERDPPVSDYPNGPRPPARALEPVQARRIHVPGADGHIQTAQDKAQPGQLGVTPGIVEGGMGI